ncbi:MAG: trigger factor [Lawsonibacter sp.]
MSWKPYIERATRLVSVERKAQKGDTAVIDFEGFDNGKPFEGGKGENYELKLGSGSFVPGFEEQLIGLKAGEEKDLDITFPEDYADLAGKAVVFHVKVKEVKEPQAPEVDDEFAKDVSEFETLDAFRKDLGEKLKPSAARPRLRATLRTRVLEQLIDNMECEIPDGMVEVQLDKVMDDYAMRLQSQGISMDDYLKMMGMTPEMMRASAQPSALRQVQMELALDRRGRGREHGDHRRGDDAEITSWPSSTTSPRSR